VARSLSADLDIVQIRAERKPAFKVLVYDVRSSSDTIGLVVRQQTSATPPTLNALTGPRDFTNDVESVSIEEVAGNYVDPGIAASTVTLQIVDPNNLFDPFLTKADPTSDGRWLRAGNVVQIIEGDEDVDEDDWEITFTGEIIGQAGVARSRAVGRGAADITVKAVGREVGFLRYNQVSEEFGQGAAYLTVANTLATNDMGLDSDEVDLSGWGTQTNSHLSLQFVDEPALVSIAKLMFIDGFMPRFNGFGVLTNSQGLITQSPKRVYFNFNLFQILERPFNETAPPNMVTVRGLDADLSKIIQEPQELATISITTGYFTQNEEKKVLWSDDMSLLAENIRLIALRSVNGGLNGLGGGEDFTVIPAASPLQGTVGAVIEFSTGFAPWLIVILLVVYIVLAAIPDEVALVLTIPVGRIIQAITLSAALIIMTKIGRGDYVLVGEPFEMVYEEIRGIAKITGTLAQDLDEIIIDNHLVQNQADADSSARNVLFRQQVRRNERRVQMLHDLRLEVDDVFETPDARRYLIERISRVLSRRSDEVVANLSCFEVTEGVLP
jgi:hypothetical protein